jgi:hypothetical protein
MEPLTQLELDYMYTTVPGLRDFVKSKMPEFKPFMKKQNIDTTVDLGLNQRNKDSKRVTIHTTVDLLEKYNTEILKYLDSGKKTNMSGD